MSFDTLATELEQRFSEGLQPWSDEEFNALALRCFAEQFRTNYAYRAYSMRRNQTPENVLVWEDVPSVPAAAFKHLDLIALESGEPETVFVTSGTTRGSASRGRHLVRSLALYRSSLLPAFKAHLLPDVERIVFASLIPSPAEASESSLSFMVAAAAEAFASDVHWLVDGHGALDIEGMRKVFASSSRAGQPVLLLGTAFAFVHVLGLLGSTALEPLAPGSRVMETGGFKGRARDVTRDDLYTRIARTTGVPVASMVNEYGMTELLSQLYEPVLTEGPGAAGAHVPPPWLRVRALDPVTLVPLPTGEEGILAFFDLANLGSVCHVLTDDLGMVVGGRVRLAGRLPGSEARGCSLALEELITSAALGR